MFKNKKLHNLPKAMKSAAGRIGTTATVIGGSFLPAIAMAQDGIGAQALAEVSGLRGDVVAIIGVLVTVVFALVAWAYFKKTR